MIERETCGWYELTAMLPASTPVLTDLRALAINARLRGSSRVARAFGSSRPHLRADVCVERVGNRAEWATSTGEDFRAVAHMATGASDALPVSIGGVPSVTEIERACAETGWRAIAGDGAGLRVEVPTRYSVHVARLDSSPCAGLRFVIDLRNLDRRPDVCRRAAAALLLAVSGSVRLVKGAVVDGDVDRRAALISTLDAASVGAVDDALSALSVAGEGVEREIEALMNERLAAEYLALSCAASEEEVRVSMEEDLCLQQP